MVFKPQDHYFKEAKKAWYKARSAFKLEEIDQKYHIFDKSVKTVLDIWCAPWSWLQYVQEKMAKTHGLRVDQGANMPLSLREDQWTALWAEDALHPKQKYTIIWFDLKEVEMSLPWVYTYKQDIQDIDTVYTILQEHTIKKFDAIISDMAPNTIGFRDVDAMRSIELLRITLPLYEQFLREWWRAVIKIFMGPWFDEFITDFKKIVGNKNIKTFKPQAVRKESKEIYIVKF